TRADRALRVTLWYPAAGPPGGRVRADADPARGRFPVILFSHGLGGAPADYRQLVTRWAAAGFVVAAPAYPFTNRDAPRVDVLDVLNQPADASHVLSRVLALNSAAGDPLRGRLETGRVAAAGHSAGAITTIGLFTLARDARLDAGIVLAGTSLGVGTAFSGAAAPLMFVHGARDNVVSYAAGKAAYDSVPWPKALLTLPEGDHGRALSDGDDPSFRVVADTTVEFLRWSLYGDPAAKRRLPTDAARGNRATLDNRL
ncbi:MAG TPA: dienelactone hydrolase family protein, partial [Pilimelia sp.]|nr:dienelactone hydrolase family protein [Pilimelia sp.]